MEEVSVKFTPGSPLRGWLRKQGGKMRGWQRRFFVLYDSCLFIFHREDDTQMASSYCLHEHQLKDVPASPDDPDKFIFELVSGELCLNWSQVSLSMNWSQVKDVPANPDEPDKFIFELVTGEFVLELVSGEFVIELVTGEVVLELLTGEVVLELVTGEVVLELVTGEFVLELVTGELVFELVTGEVVLELLTGEVVLELVTGEFVFELVTDKGNGDSIILSASSDPEKKEWMKGLCYNMYAEKGGAIFGLPLELAMKYEHRRGRNVPYIVETCVHHLERFGLDAEGIFRLAGRAGLLRELRAQFEMARRPALDDIDVHTVGSLLKAYLRELPESLVPPDLYQRIMNCAMRHAETSCQESRQEEVECLCKLLEELPDINYTTLAYICRFLHKLASHADKTKMTAHNLALVFGPNLIRHLDSSPELLMLTADLTQHLAFMLFQHCPEVLPPRPQREAVPLGATDSPLLRKKLPGAGHVATADLLRMSEPLDVKDPLLLLPHPSTLRNLMSLELFPQQGDGRDSSPNTSPSPFLFVNDYFDKTDRRVHERRWEARSKSMRTRRSACTPDSPKSPDSPRHLDSQDILAALASANEVPPAASLPGHNTGEKEQTPGSDDKGGGEGNKTDIPRHAPKLGNRPITVGRSISSYERVHNGKTSADKSWRSPEADTLLGTDAGRLRPSQTILEAQVTALQSELSNVKARSEHMVAALQRQLTEIRAKYEARISCLESQQHREMMDLTAKLDAEKTARAEALDKTVTLQAQLYRYRLQYGDLPDAQSPNQ
ncbi:hypothetical protein ACOMHN_006597 [Nucella lapillus]